ncbi:MAG: SemiSWEET transporter [Fibrobacter sp.]|jgi:MtN3 and saliva related transmembrane protein|nr:SemiSWEET transporter [Fibrobacter sp.]
MDFVTIIGLIAGSFTTISFFPQVIRVFKTRSTRDISLWMFLLFTIGVLLWLIYGIYLKQWPVILSNLLTLISAIIILGFKLKYK